MAIKRKNQIVRIRENKAIAPGYYKISLISPFLARVSCPGQFCLLNVPGVFLKRPLSVYSAGGAKVAFLYKVVGPGTENLSKLKPGREIEVLGPLGTGYNVKTLNGKRPVLVAGGTGIASLNFLAEKLKVKGILFCGAKTKKELAGLEKFRKSGWKIEIATDDGTQGFKGFVTGLLKAYLSAPERRNEKGEILYCCGPRGMLKECKSIAEKHEIEACASMEEMVACGTGSCQGCVVKIKGEYKRVCADGPVFRLQDIEA
ncbi:MAG: dihydroorotate dehydrogenase electron transfer subunit [Elusimicrobiota bacterium]